MKRRTGIIIAAIATPTFAFAGLKLTRAGYESQKYEVTKKLDGFEIRSYPDMNLVSTKMSPAAGRGEQDSRFMRLFRYIDKGNADSQKIAMTTPVFMESDGATGAMSFVLPAKVAAAGAPEPAAEEVYLNKVRGGDFAAMRFRGGQNSGNERAAVAKLRDAMAKSGLEAAKGDPMFAYYDPPWIPKVLRRNEVLIRLAK